MKLVVIITVLLCHMTASQKETEDRQINVVLKYSTCIPNKKYVDKMLCKYRPVNRTTSWSSTDIYFHPGLKVEAPIQVEFITYKKFGTIWRPFMIKVKIELCSFLELKNHPLYAVTAANGNRSESNMLDSCPLQGHRYVKPYYVEFSKVPPILPVGEWRTNTILTKEKNGQIDELYRILSYYTVTSRGTEEF